MASTARSRKSFLIDSLLEERQKQLAAAAAAACAQSEPEEEEADEEEEEEEEEEEAGSTWFLSSPSKSCPWCSSGQSPSGLGLDLEEALEAMEGSELEATTKTVLINVSAWLPSFLYTLQHLQVCLFCPVYKSGYPKHTQEGLKLLHFR